jgi:cell division protease FtsH
VTGDETSGAVQDIMQATRLARTMILDWGMSEKLGFVRYAPIDQREMYMGEREFSEETAQLIDREVRRFIDEAYQDAERILEANWEKVVAVAEALLKYETLTDDEVARLMRGEQLHKPSVAELLAAEEPDSKPTGKKPRGRDEGPEIPPGSVVPSPA